MEIFGRKIKEFCYAGVRMIDVELETGWTTACYCGRFSQNIFENLEKPIEFLPIGKCKFPYCFNGHAMLTLGCVPHFTKTTYAELRDRVRQDGTHWLHEPFRSFISQKLDDENPTMSKRQEFFNNLSITCYKAKRKIKKLMFRK
jgi:hypothetical protein